MGNLTFNGVFRTTNMGIPNLSPLPKETYLSKSFYGYSIAVQSIIFLYFIAYFILSIIRVIKKIKNSRFRELGDEREEEVEMRSDG